MRELLQWGQIMVFRRGGRVTADRSGVKAVRLPHYSSCGNHPAKKPKFEAGNEDYAQSEVSAGRSKARQSLASRGADPAVTRVPHTRRGVALSPRKSSACPATGYSANGARVPMHA